MSVEVTVQEFAERFGRRLVVLCISMTGNEHDGWDLAQATFERLARAWSRRVPDDPWAYAVRVSTNLNIDRIRRLRREILQSDPEPPPVEMQLATELEPWLRQALNRLTPGQRTALALRHLEDLSIEEIAATMRTSQSTVRTHLSRGSATLRGFQTPPNTGRNQANE